MREEFPDPSAGLVKWTDFLFCGNVLTMPLSLELSQKALLLWAWILRRLRTLESLPRNVSSPPLGLRWAWIGCASTGLLVCFSLLDTLILEWGELDTLRRRSSKIHAYGVVQGCHGQSLIQGRWSGKESSPVVWYFVSAWHEMGQMEYW